MDFAWILVRLGGLLGPPAGFWRPKARNFRSGFPSGPPLGALLGRLGGLLGRLGGLLGRLEALFGPLGQS